MSNQSCPKDEFCDSLDDDKPETIYANKIMQNHRKEVYMTEINLKNYFHKDLAINDFIILYNTAKTICNLPYKCWYYRRKVIILYWFHKHWQKICPHLAFIRSQTDKLLKGKIIKSKKKSKKCKNKKNNVAQSQTMTPKNHNFLALNPNTHHIPQPNAQQHLVHPPIFSKNLQIPNFSFEKKDSENEIDQNMRNPLNCHQFDS